MASESRKRLPVSVGQAEYTPSKVEDYAGNPLIEALPIRLEPRPFRERLTVMIESEDVSRFTLSDKEAYVNEVFKMRVLSRQHLDLYYDIYAMLSNGYVHRNPNRAEVVSWSYDIADPDVSQQDVNRPFLPSVIGPSVSEALFLTGFSGNGKTTMTEHILFNLFPRVVNHTGADFEDIQVVYLKVDMPHDAVRSALIYSLLEELDYVLSNTSYGDPRYRDLVKKNDGRFITIEKMKDVLLTACNRHHVGLIVLDEFQNIKVVSPIRRNEMIQLLDELSNQLFIPFIKIGTPDLLTMFPKAVHKRRLGRPVEFNCLSEPKVWSRLMEMLYNFQPLAHPIERDEKIDALMLNLTAAVPAYALGLWKETIIKAMRTGEEKISIKLIRQAFKERFPLLKSVVRNINKNRRGSYDDLLTVQQYLDESESDLALKHLQHIVKNSGVEGMSASDVLEDINTAFNPNEMDLKQRSKLSDIKKQLVKKSQAVLGPQTIEHQTK